MALGSFFFRQLTWGALCSLLLSCDNNAGTPALWDDSSLPGKDAPLSAGTPTPQPVQNSRVQTVDEPPGSHCPVGGKAIQMWTEKGGDPDHFDDRIDSGLTISYACHGEKSKDTVILTAVGTEWNPEPAGSRCPMGGKKYRPFVDNGDGNGVAGDGLRNGTEAYVAGTAWQYVCDGVTGKSGMAGTRGADGRVLGMDWADENQGLNCAAGGKKFRPFVDDGAGGGTSGDGLKNGDEVYLPFPWQYICHGSQGSAGTNGTNGTNGSAGIDGLSLGIDWNDEPVGAHCSHGGKKYRVFIDDGTSGGIALDGLKNGSEAYATGSDWQYVCNGFDGLSLALDMATEASGVNCASGGKKIRPFVDNGVVGGVKNDGLRNGGEDYVPGTTWQYVCNGLNGGADGQSIGLEGASEDPGANCSTGGLRFRPFLDSGVGGGFAGDGIKNGTEPYVTPSAWLYACHGSVGAMGQSVGLEWNTEPPGAHCPSGGLEYRPFLDNGVGGGVAHDGVKNGTEDYVSGSTWEYVCNGVHGTGLVMGALAPFSGNDSGNAPAGCANGGQKYQLYRDDNNNNVKDADETSPIGPVQYLCMGATGATGATGVAGVQGSGLVMSLLTPFLGNDGGNAPATCENGGQKYQLYRDDNNNGVKDDGETSAIGPAQYLCVGSTGATGAQGKGVVPGGLVVFSGNDSGNAPAGCVNGGQKFQLYRDDNNNGVKDAGETTLIGGLQYLCVGATGATGTQGPGLVTGPLSSFSGDDSGNAPTGCTQGGQKYQLYRDDNNNGGKDVDETTAIGPVQYLCHGATGATGAQGTGVVVGAVTLFSGDDNGNAPSGCADGGQKYQFYRDDNNNGVKDPGESTPIGVLQYLCMGASGPTGATGIQGAGLVIGAVSSFSGNDNGNAPAGCATGGQKYQFYRDDNNNGGKDVGETTAVGPVQYLCTGATGATGAQGNPGTGLVMGSITPFTGNDSGNAPSGCTTGGQKYQLYRDDNNNAVKDVGETTAIGVTQYLCSGATGATGAQGPGLVMVLSAFTGNDSGNAPSGCTNGGQKYQFYRDDNNNGGKDAGETTTIGSVQYLCVGPTGATGATGQGVGMALSAENPGANCAYGGQKLIVFIDNGAGGGTANNGIKDGTESVISSQYLCTQSARRNVILNGDMRVSSLLSGGALSRSWAQPADKFTMAWVGTGVLTGQQSSVAPTGFANSLSLTVATAAASFAATDFYSVQQSFPAGLLGSGTTEAAYVTVSFWVRSSLTGTFPFTLRNKDVTRSYVTSYSISAANTWEKKVITIPKDSQGWSGNAQVSWDFGTGSTYTTATTNSWMSGNFVNTSGMVNLISQVGATFYLTGVQVECGATATPFAYRTLTEELTLLGLMPYTEVVSWGAATLSNAAYTSVGSVTLGQEPVIVDVTVAWDDFFDMADGFYHVTRCTAAGSFVWNSTATANSSVLTIPCEYHSSTAITLSVYLEAGNGARVVKIKPSSSVSVTATGFVRARFFKFGSW